MELIIPLVWFLSYAICVIINSYLNKKWWTYFTLLYPFITAPLFLYCYVYIIYIHPYEKENIVSAVIQGERYYRRYYNTYYWYEVNGKMHWGTFSRRNSAYSERYDRGDTIDITYNVDDPRCSMPTYQQYWYINKDKEKYWQKIIRGEGRRK